jgi:hypothetical protein
MTRYGTWAAYSGNEAIVLAILLLIVAGLFTFLGSRLRQPIRAQRAGKFIGVSIALIWLLSGFVFLSYSWHFPASAC